jgi:hypothetical protein
MRSAERGRAISRSVESSSVIGRAPGIVDALASSISAITGIAGSPRVSMH